MVKKKGELAAVRIKWLALPYGCNIWLLFLWCVPSACLGYTTTVLVGVLLPVTCVVIDFGEGAHFEARVTAQLCLLINEVA